VPADARPATGLRLRAMDTLVDLDFGGSLGASLAHDVRRAWARCLVPSGSDAADVHLQVVLDEDPAVVAAASAEGALACTDRTQVLDALSPRVTVAAITHQAGALMMLHACGLAGGDGRTIGLVGPSGTGKTTASRTLGARLGYVTDEALAIRPDGTVAAYPKPLSIKVDGSPFKDQVSPDDLGLAPTPAANRLVGLAVLSRDGSAEPWVEDISTVQALAMLATESSFLVRVPSPLHRLAEIVDGAGGLRVLHYAEAAHLVGLVDRILGEER
jgi:hypothetical protein